MDSQYAPLHACISEKKKRGKGGGGVHVILYCFSTTSIQTFWFVAPVHGITKYDNILSRLCDLELRLRICLKHANSKGMRDEMLKQGVLSVGGNHKCGYIQNV